MRCTFIGEFALLQIVAVIICCSGTALLAYMDGIYETQTLLGVVFAAASAAAIAVFKVITFFKIVKTTGCARGKYLLKDLKLLMHISRWG